jgi:hypothetical protein
MIPKNDDLSIYSAEINMPLELKQADSIQGLSTEYAITGAFRYPETGTTLFGFAGNIAPTSTSLDTGKDSYVKSIYISIPLSHSVILNDNQEGITQDFNVYRLKKEIDSSTLYNNSIKEDMYEHTPVNTSVGTYAGEDSIKIFLDKSLGEELLTATQNELDTTSLFMARFRGLYVKCNPPAEGVYGGRMNQFDLSSSYIYLKYNFQPVWAENLARKDTTVLFYLGYSYCLNTSSFGSADLEKTVEETKNLSELPIEGMAGIKPFIDGHIMRDTLLAWAERNNIDPRRIAIIRARYTFNFPMPPDFDMDAYPSYIYPNYRNTDTTNIYYYPLTDVNSDGNNHGGLNRSLNTYSGDISSYIQNLLIKDNSEIDGEDNIWFSSLSASTSSYYGTTSYTFDQNGYYVGKLYGPADERNKPKLSIIYSIIPEEGK